jgi:hypothetical protein
MSKLHRILLIVCSYAVSSYAETPSSIDSFTVHENGGKPARIRVTDYPVTVVIFISAVCPMSIDYSTRITTLGKDYSSDRTRLIVVNSNYNETDKQISEQRKRSGLSVPIVRDPLGGLATLLQVYSTPTAVVLDQSGVVRYWGAIDDARNPERVTRSHLRLAVQAILAGKTVERSRTRVMGCTIKRQSLP